MTEQEIVKDIKENKIGKYQEKDLQNLIREANSICDKVKFDTPLSAEIASYGHPHTSNIAFDDSWRRARNLQESIDIALNRKEQWNSSDNEKLYTVLSSMRMALHNSLAWLTTDSKYKAAYKWLDEKESFYQKNLKERNERILDPFKKAQWDMELKTKEKSGIPVFETQTCTWVYLDYNVGKDGHYYDINKKGEVKKSDLTLNEVLSRNSNSK